MKAEEEVSEKKLRQEVEALKVAALQLDVAWEDRKTNYRRVREFANRSAGEGADLFVLPEMFATGFSMKQSVTAESIDGETATFIRVLASDLKMAVLGGFVLHGEDGRGRNSALTVDREGRDLALYTKTHLFSFMGEEQHHEQGDGPKPFELEGVRCTCFICYDLRFPELFRMVADRSDAVFVISSWPGARQQHWDTLLRARAVENQQYVVGVNRVGEGGGHDYTGGSAIYDPLGDEIAHGRDKECLLVAQLDPTHVKEVRKSMPFLRDRRFI